jgi:four helix bundle protein
MLEAKLEIRNSKLASKRDAAVNDFTDLKAWQLARELRQEVYQIARKLPADERHVLSSQIRRAALSVTANIAEGFGRFSFQENIQFCRQARGSAFEVRDHLIAALDGGYVTRQDWEKADALAQRTIQVLNGYIRSTRELQKKKAGSEPKPI